MDSIKTKHNHKEEHKCSGSPSSIGLPPPYAFETLYSSYQNEWDSNHHRRQKYCTDDNEGTDDEDIIIMDLQFLIMTNKNDESVMYLLACTSGGDLVVWKKANNRNQSSDSKYHFLTKKSISKGALHKMALFDHATENHTSNNGDFSTFKKRKRTTSSSSSSDGNSNSNSTHPILPILFVAGEDGLWNFPLHNDDGSWFSDDGEDDNGKYFHLIEGRSITYIQVFQQHLYVLDQDCISKWNPVECQPQQQPMARYPLWFRNNNHNKRTQKKEYPTTMLVTKNHRRLNDDGAIQALVGTNRSRIWILPMTETGEDDNGTKANPCKPQFLSLDSSNNNDADKNNDKSRDKSKTVPPVTKNAWRFGDSSATSFSSSSSVTDPSSSLSTTRTTGRSWIVTRIVETHGTWWTVAAMASKEEQIPAEANRNDTRSGGLLKTWHAPTRTVMASCQTRESIQNIIVMSGGDGITPLPASYKHKEFALYSVANEGVISLWKSPFHLERIGRLWISPPSTKAIATVDVAASGAIESRQNMVHVENENYVPYDSCFREVMAIAGVGNEVDILLDNCIVQTLTNK
jgi:hypothetical protein